MILPMNTVYDHEAIEKKWQKKWGKNAYKTADTKAGKENFYLLTEFPYPSGNLHVGHWYAFAVPDILARYLRMKGKNVLYPIGFDAFGLPAENAALKHGLNPRKWTEENIAYMRKQFLSMGASFDWPREVVTSAPEYYRWTQWLFLQLFKRGLVYRKKTANNWCPSCKTVLANEQVKDEKCERCDTLVEQKQMEQWHIKITAYAERLLADLEKLDWPKEIKATQKNWIGKSEGAEIEFQVKYNPSPTLPKGKGEKPGYYSTNATNFRLLHEKALEMRENPTEAEKTLWNALKGGREGFHFRQQHIINRFIVDFVCLSKKLVIEIDGDIHDAQKERDAERENILKTLGFRVIRFTNAEVMEHTENVVKQIVDILKVLPFGEDLGGVVLKKIKVFTTRPDTLFGVSFLALSPEHPLAKDAENLKAVNPANGEEVPLVVADYVLGEYGTGAVMGVPAHDERDFAFAKERGLPIKNDPLVSEDVWGKFGKKTVQYKLRDWTVSRQRYWGVPIPLVHCKKCSVVPVPDKNLPVKLPEIKDYVPTGDGKSPLAKAEKWKRVKCPKCGVWAERETDTLDTFVDSSWYFLRYIDPKNKKVFASRAKMDAWLPVDFYSGGVEHTTMHLLYSRFWHKALYDAGLVADDEPYVRRMNRGLIMGPDEQKMSKSRGNVIDPDEEVRRLGADTVRMYLAFIGPYNETGSYPWNPQGAVGVRRFLERVWKLQTKIKTQNSLSAHVLEKLLSATARKRADFLARKSASSEKHAPNKSFAFLHQTIKKVGEAIETFKMNTGVAALMSLLNVLEKEQSVAQDTYETFLRLLAPYAPHISEELWAALGNPPSRRRFGRAGKKSIHNEPWPSYDAQNIQNEEVTIVVQINGKVRGSFTAARGISETDAFAHAEALPEVQKHLVGARIAKRVLVKDRLVSFATS